MCYFTIQSECESFRFPFWPEHGEMCAPKKWSAQSWWKVIDLIQTYKCECVWVIAYSPLNLSRHFNQQGRPNEDFQKFSYMAYRKGLSRLWNPFPWELFLASCLLIFRKWQKCILFIKRLLINNGLFAVTSLILLRVFFCNSFNCCKLLECVIKQNGGL